MEKARFAAMALIILIAAQISPCQVYQVSAAPLNSLAQTGLEVAQASFVTNASTTEDTQSVSGLVIMPNPEDPRTPTHYKISSIVGGALYKNNGTTRIHNGDFITLTEGIAGLKFTPEADANNLADDRFSFQVQATLDSSGNGISPAAKAEIIVYEVNDPPVAINDTLSPISESVGSLAIPNASLLANDLPGPFNEQGQTLSIHSVDNSVGGSVSLSGENVIFTPTVGYNGQASFRYSVTDNGTTSGSPDPKSATATVSFTINKVVIMPTVSVRINHGEGFTNQRVVTLNMTASDSSDLKMAFSNDGVAWSPLESFAATKPWTLSSGGGNKTVYVKFMIDDDHKSIQTASIILDQEAPTGAFQINNGTAVTHSSTIELDTIYSDNLGPVEISLSFDNLIWSPWETALSKHSVTLPAGDGAKTVYMKWRDAAGNEQAAISNTIILDTTPPTIELSINAGAAYTTSRQVTLSISGSDANEPLEYRQANEDDNWTNWGPLPERNWELTSGDGVKIVKLEARDTAGNIAALSQKITLNAEQPIITGVVDGGIYNSDVVISFNKGTATLNNVLFSSDTTVSQEGTYKLIVTDIAGLETEVNFIIDKTAPSGSFTINNGAATSSSTQVTLSIAATDNLGQIQMRIANDNEAWSNWQPYTSTLNWTLPNGNGQKKVLLELRDEAGNVGMASASITLNIKSSDGAESGGSGSSGSGVNGSGSGSTTGGTPILPAPVQPKEPEIKPVKPHSTIPTFSDITGHWAESDIKLALEKAIVGGYPDATFKPNASITRAELTVMLATALKLEGGVTPFRFSDEKQIGSWAKQAINQALQAGIISGYEDGSFRPNASITRTEMMVMFARALNLPIDAKTASLFADDKAIPEWAKGAVHAMYRIGVVHGRSENRFAPNATATRAEAVAMLIRMLEIIEHQ